MSTEGASFKDHLAIINASPIGMILVDDKGDIVFSNPKAEDIFGYTHDEFSGLAINQLVPQELHKIHEAKRKNFMNNSSPHAMDYGRLLPAQKQDGQEIQVQIGLTPLQVLSQHYVLVSIIDTSNQVVKIASYHDALTGLANRNLFKEIATNLRNLAIRHQTSLSILFLDLDGFKNVNDQFGHACGDNTLCSVANILNNSVRKNDIACRLGGDEFVMCFYGIESISHLESLSKGLIEKISSLNHIGDCKVDISASIGAVHSLTPEQTSIEEMIKLADKYMYAAKKAGKGRVISNNNIRSE